MGVFGESIVRAARRTRTYAEKLVKDVPAEKFARVPVVAGVTIQTNHPAFVLGHLSLYPARLARLAGVSDDGLATPAGWEALFKNGAPCLDDPKATIYPGMTELVQTFFRVHDHAFERIERLDDSAFAKANPDERYREAFPIVGMACAFLLNNHVAIDLGQVSAWRRCMGLGPVN
jgi:DinB superfamily